MEQEHTAASVADDYRRCERIWQRVNPALNPYPGVNADAAETDGRASVGTGAELSLPGAQADPCCMGTEAMESLDVVQGFIREELSGRRDALLFARRMPTAEARRVFRDLAADGGRHARMLISVVYLITGERYAPVACNPPLRYEGCGAALRAAYHEVVCRGFNYRRAAEEALDPCLKKLLMDFSQEEYRHARRILDLLAGMM